MKAILKILYVLLALILLVLLAGIFMPKSTNVTVEKDMRAAPDLVFKQLNNVENWKNWLTWLEADTNVTIKLGEIKTGRGASYTWQSDNAGSGTMIITDSEPNTALKVQLDYGDMGTANMEFSIDNQSFGSKVEWTFYDDTLAYFERYFVTLFTNNMRNAMKRGLDHMEEVTNDIRLSRISAIKTISLESQPAMIIRDSAKMEDMDSLSARQFEVLTKYFERRKFEPAGNPFTIYFKWNPEGYTHFAVGYPIPERTWGWKQYEYFPLPAGEAATVTHWGLYSSEKPYLALNEYLENQSEEVGDFIWEEYTTLPSATEDTSKWQKQIYYPFARAEEE